MIKACALLDRNDAFRVWVYDTSFKVYEVPKTGDNILIDDDKYRDYSHFWNVYGKFNPEVGFKPEDKWVEVSALTYKNLAAISSQFKEIVSTFNNKGYNIVRGVSNILKIGTASSGNWGHGGRPGERGGSSSGGEHRPAGGKVDADTFVAAMQRFSSTDLQKIIDERKADAPQRLHKLLSGKGTEMDNFAANVKGASSEKIAILKDIPSAGAWLDTHTNKVTGEPSFNMVVKGTENEIIKRAVLAGQAFNQKMVIVGVHDKSARGSGMYTLSTDKLTLKQRASIIDKFTSAGLGGVTMHIDANSFKMVAGDRASMRIIEKVAKGLPGTWNPKLKFIPARTMFIDKSEYAQYARKKAVSPIVTADVIIMGVGNGPIAH